MDAMTHLRYVEQWQGVYREFHFKIVHHSVRADQPGGIWNYYLYVPLERLPEAARPCWLGETRVLTSHPNQRPHMYRDTSVLPDLKLHHGCTYYCVHEDDGNAPLAEIGCDYIHYWDEGQRYTVEDVAGDAQRSIDALWQTYPDILHRCCYCGGYFHNTEGESMKNEWIDHKCLAKCTAKP